jgi:hypothetical protein
LFSLLSSIDSSPLFRDTRSILYPTQTRINGLVEFSVTLYDEGPRPAFDLDRGFQALAVS